MPHVFARAVIQIVVDDEGAKTAFVYPSEVGDRGTYCGLIDHWSKAEIWASVRRKLVEASVRIKERIERVHVVRDTLGPKVEEALEVAMNGGTVELDAAEYKFLREICDAVARPQFFSAHPGQCVSPMGLMMLWPILKSLSQDVGEAKEAPVLEGWLTD